MLAMPARLGLKEVIDRCSIGLFDALMKVRPLAWGQLLQSAEPRQTCWLVLQNRQKCSLIPRFSVQVGSSIVIGMVYLKKPSLLS